MELIAGLGYPAAVVANGDEARREHAVRAGTAAARRADAAAGQVDLAPRGAAGRDERRHGDGPQSPAGRGHRLDASRRPAAGSRDRRATREASSGSAAPGLRGARANADRIDVGNAGTLLRLLPGWLAGQPSGHWTLDGDESIRRRPVDRVVEPLTAMGARLGCRDGRLPPLTVEGSPLRGHPLPASRRERAGEVVRAARRTAGAGRDHGDRGSAQPRPHGADAAPGRGGGEVGQQEPSASRASIGSRSRASTFPATSPRPPSTWWPAVLVADSRRWSCATSASTRRAPGCWT